MTTKDKTGDQLMASIRKAKTEGATPDSEAAVTPQAAPATRKAATPKAKPAAAGAAKRPRTTRKKVAARSGTAKTAPAAQGSAYQSAGRVWPD